MAIEATDIKYLKSAIVSDISTNGGRKGQVEVISGVRHSLFPRVTKGERTLGVTRYRKEFWTNLNAADDIAYGVLQWIEVPSNAEDRFLFLEGTQIDTQAALTAPSGGAVPLWLGTGTLNTALNGGESQVILDMEADDFVFENGGHLHISNKIKTSQTVAADVVIGNSVTFGTQWEKTTATDDITYPLGLYLGDNKVLSMDDLTVEEWLLIADKITADEVIGAGDGTSVSPTLATLTNITNGICQVKGKLPVITTVNTADAVLTAYINPDGTVDVANSDASAGELNMETGAWVTSITWDSAPKSAQNVLCTYRERAFSYTGNTVTIELDDTVSNPYAIANTTAGGCTYSDEVKATTDMWVETSASGTYDEAANPVVAHNEGAEEEAITITFTDATTFSVAGSNSGSLGTGFLISADCTALNPTTGKNMFTLVSAGWGGTWASGDTIAFNLHPPAAPIWVKEIVPAGTAQESNNLIVFGWYAE